jgi:hypothetical protein
LLAVLNVLARGIEAESNLVIGEALDRNEIDLAPDHLSIRNGSAAHRLSSSSASHGILSPYTEKARS